MATTYIHAHSLVKEGIHVSKLSMIEGIGESYESKLKVCGIGSVEEAYTDRTLRVLKKKRFGQSTAADAAARVDKMPLTIVDYCRRPC